MPYAPFGFQTPVPAYPPNMSPWLPDSVGAAAPETFGPPNPLNAMALDQARQMHRQMGNMDPAQLAQLALPTAFGLAPRLTAAGYGALLPMLPSPAGGAEK